MKFLLVRYTHGSGGKFLSSVLQTSSVVDHWSATLQSHKSDPNWLALVEQYTKRSFPSTHELALRSEPHAPYNCDLYSTSRDRGADVDLAQYLAHAKQCQDHRLLALQDSQRSCNLIFNRPCVPKFCHRMPAVTVTVSTHREREWLDKTLWSKHFIVNDQEIIYAPDDPDYCHITRLPDVLKYANTSRWHINDLEKIKQDLVINNPTRDWYFNPEKFESWDRGNGIDNYFLPLWSFFHERQFEYYIMNIFSRFDLGQPDMRVIEMIRRLWINSQHNF